MTIPRTKDVHIDTCRPPYQTLESITGIDSDFLESLHNSDTSRYKSHTCAEFVRDILDLHKKTFFVIHDRKNDILIVTFRDED